MPTNVRLSLARMEHSVLMALDPINVCVQMDSMVKTVIKVRIVSSVSQKCNIFNNLLIIFISKSLLY